MGIVDWRAIDATTADESTPPERNAPSGTSAIIRSRTASSRRSSSCSAIRPGGSASGSANDGRQ